MKHGSNDLIPQEMYINLLCMNDIPPELPILPCMCASFRRASRALTEL